MVKVLVLLTRWFVPFQFARQQKDLEKFVGSANSGKNKIRTCVSDGEFGSGIF